MSIKIMCGKEKECKAFIKTGNVDCKKCFDELSIENEKLKIENEKFKQEIQELNLKLDDILEQF